MALKPSQVLEQVNQAIDMAVKESQSKAFTDPLGKFMAKQLVRRTKLGFGVDEYSSQQVRLKPLSDSYKKVRRGDLNFFTSKAAGRPIIPTGKAAGLKAKTSRKSRKKKGLISSLFGKKRKAPSRGDRGKKIQKRLRALHGSTTPNKSNLTATGQMLRSVRGYGRFSKIIIEIPDSGRTEGLTGKKTSKLLVFHYIIETRRH